MEKIYFNKDGFVCNRYPLDLPIDNESNFVEVDDITFSNTFVSKPHFAWMVKNGELVEERYEEDNEIELADAELNSLYEWFKWYDTQTIQYNRDIRLYGTSKINIEKLDKLAVENAARIKELNKILS